MEQPPNNQKKEGFVDKAKHFLTRKAFQVGLTTSAVLPMAESALATPTGNDNEKERKETVVAKHGQEIPENAVMFSSGVTEGEQVQGLHIYDKSKTVEGGITPTGKSNSFYENADSANLEDAYMVARAFNFPTNTNKAYQEASVKWLKKNDPEKLRQILENEFGPTNHLKEISPENRDNELTAEEQSLIDDDFGARTIFITQYLITKIPPPEKEIPPPIITERQPEGGYMINVRGDWKNGQGGYYFLKDRAAFERFTKIVQPHSLEFNGTDKGQATYDMPLATFLKDHVHVALTENKDAPEAQEIIDGQDLWVRDPKNETKFILKTSVNLPPRVDRVGP